MINLNDQLGRMVTLEKPAQKIVSLVPSQTELLSDLGLDDGIVGITKFCIYPAHLRKKKSIVGGTKNINHAAIEALRPDLIIANKEENVQSDIELLATMFPVYVSDVYDLESARQMIADIGALTNTTEKATAIIKDINTAKADYPKHPQDSVLYLIWKNPWMAAGSDTFIHTMLEEAGYTNVLEAKRYPTLTPQEIMELDPDVVLLSSEPYPFTESHIQEITMLLPGCRVRLADGSMFSWYGSRLRKAWAYFKTLRQND
jgi:ABC-type Fe3+-hydroxamate transport system substrate-binding protein